MTKTELRRFMNVWGNAFYKDTCYNLQAEIVKKIMNNKILGDFEKMTFLNQYVGNLVTNECVIENLKRAETHR